MCSYIKLWIWLQTVYISFSDQVATAFLPLCISHSESWWTAMVLLPAKRRGRLCLPARCFGSDGKQWSIVIPLSTSEVLWSVCLSVKSWSLSTSEVSWSLSASEVSWSLSASEVSWSLSASEVSWSLTTSKASWYRCLPVKWHGAAFYQWNTMVLLFNSKVAWSYCLPVIGVEFPLPVKYHGPHCLPVKRHDPSVFSWSAMISLSTSVYE